LRRELAWCRVCIETLLGRSIRVVWTRAGGGVKEGLAPTLAATRPLSASAPTKPVERPGSSTDPPPDDRELAAYVRRKVISGVLLLAVLIGGVGFVSIFYEAELLAFTKLVFDTVGFGGLVFILFLSDSVITPIPPDAVLLVISKSSLHAHWPLVILGIGVMSSVAGCVGWALGGKLRSTRLGRRWLSRAKTNRALVERYGPWAVALGALTPIPFSVTCWTAGLFEMRFAPFAVVTLLRVPRFVGYYAAIAYAEPLLRLLM
jgi:membrane protein YqaA with SNARE-associated domain